MPRCQVSSAGRSLKTLVVNGMEDATVDAWGFFGLGRDAMKDVAEQAGSYFFSLEARVGWLSVRTCGAKLGLEKQHHWR